MKIWDEMVKVALIGTDRGTLSEESTAFLRKQGVDLDSPTSRILLEGMTILQQFRRAGFILVDFKETLPTPSGQTEETPCTLKSRHHLKLILEGPFGPALEEFVNQLLENKKCLPPESLPSLFDHCLNSPDLWAQIKPAIGSKGKWLLSLNPAWATLGGSNPEVENWEVSTRAERLIILKRLREESPKDAIRLLKKTWDQDSVSDKVAFLKELKTNLSLDDELFIDTALTDRRKEVRMLAADLLAQIPDSGLIERLWYLLQEMITIDAPNKLTVVLPEELTAAMKRDGIEGKTRKFQGGIKGGWVFQMIARIPPKRWEEFFGENPRDILTIIRHSRWDRLFKKALAEAILFHKDESWADALVRHWMKHDDSGFWSGSDGKKIMAILSDQSFNEIIRLGIERQGPMIDEEDLTGQLLCLGAHWWEDRTSFLVIKGFQNWMSGANSYAWNIWHYKKILEVAAYRCNPNLVENFKTGWNVRSQTWPRWQNDVERFMRVLLFRKEMILRLGYGESERN